MKKQDKSEQFLLSILGVFALLLCVFTASAFGQNNNMTAHYFGSNAVPITLSNCTDPDDNGDIFITSRVLKITENPSGTFSGQLDATAITDIGTVSTTFNIINGTASTGNPRTISGTMFSTNPLLALLDGVFGGTWSSGSTANITMNLSGQGSTPKGMCNYVGSLPMAAVPADLRISSIATIPTPAIIGRTITYAYRVENNGPNTSQNIVVTDNLPPQLTFIGCDATGGGVCGGVGNNRTVTFASRPVGGISAVINIIAFVNSSVIPNSLITNTATINTIETFDPVTANNFQTVITTAVKVALADFDGDGKSDVSVFRPDNGAWYLQQSTNGFSGVLFGFGTDKLVPADCDGDGKTDVAVYRGGTWYLQRSQLGFTGVTFGAADDIPVPADYNGDGSAEVAVFRPSNGTWYTSTNPATNYGAIQFGDANDKPVPADYDGDGKADVAVFRNGTWYLNRTTAGFTGVAFGASTDLPVPNTFVR